jgi:hypothetical protein
MRLPPFRRRTGEAQCPEDVRKHYDMGRYGDVALAACGRMCVRELQPLGLTPDGLNLGNNKPCAAICKEARVLFGPEGIPPAAVDPEAPEPFCR